MLGCTYICKIHVYMYVCTYNICMVGNESFVLQLEVLRSHT